jgi:hypothetical protein
MARVSPLAPIGEESGGWVGDPFISLPLRTPCPLHSFLYTYIERLDLFLVLYGAHVHIQLCLVHVQTDVGCMGYTRAIQNNKFTILPSLPKGSWSKMTPTNVWGHLAVAPTDRGHFR